MSHTKICNFTATKFTEKDVVRLKVAVGNMVKVKISKPRSNIQQILARKSFFTETARHCRCELVRFTIVFMTGPSSTNSIKRNSWLSFLSSITYNLENYSWRTLGSSPRGDGRGLGEPISSWSQFPYQPEFPGQCWLSSSLRWGRALSSSLWILKPSTVREIVLFRLNNDLSNTFAAQ